jgi:excisionase family DNA binding protein
VGAHQQVAIDFGAGASSAASPARARPRAARSDARRAITRDDVMTPAEVAAMLSMPKSTIYELARRGILPCARLGRTIRFLRDDVEACLRGR